MPTDAAPTSRPPKREPESGSPGAAPQPKKSRLQEGARAAPPAPPAPPMSDGTGPGTEKSRKYDRQLRIWGANGQEALENANICLINGGAVGTEILKNLVLPGIGSVTIVDGHKVEPSDLGNNFFVDEKSLGQSRAKVTAELLQELNEDVDGNKFVEEDPEEMIAKNPGFFDNFTAVIATQPLSDVALVELGRRCWANGVALFVVNLYGFLGYSRVVLPELCIVESKPEHSKHDLRICDPWPELAELCESFDIDITDTATHSHIPWIVIMYKCLKEWRAEKGTDRPTIFKEKKEFKEFVKRHTKGMEENYDEAIAAVSTAIGPREVPSEVRQLLEDPCCSDSAAAKSTPFWTTLRALRGFVEENGVLPLPGSIPDMHADTTSYIALQKVFKAKAEADVAAVTARVRDLAAETEISDDYIKLVCKNANNLRVRRFAALDAEYGEGWAAGFMGQLPDDKNLMFYIMMRAAGSFATKHKRSPGSELTANHSGPEDRKQDCELLRSELVDILSPTAEGSTAGCGLDAATVEATLAAADAYLDEMCRIAGAEIHPAAALMGGMVSQEIIKVVTKQFSPVSGGFLMNMMDGSATQIALP